jgi:hypothetical protein
VSWSALPGWIGLCLALALAGEAGAAVPPRPLPGQIAKVRVERSAEGYRLHVNGQPLFVQGAGLEQGDRAALAAAGGNAFRTWRVDRRGERGQRTLDEALQHGLFVAMGLEVGRERHGFDYDDPQAVAAQLERLRQEVRRHREHPALLLWVVGNELNLESRNPKVWNAVNDIVRMIREQDPRHPALTPLAGFDAETIAELKRRAPAVELLGVQLYGDIARLGSLREAGWDGPYLVTEWGPTGHWEVPKTAWGAPIEESSARKAQGLLQRYREFILADPAHCLGSFVFLWGQKQERTPTWYGMFLSSGEPTAAVDAMQTLWTGRAPEHPAPHVDALQLDGRAAEHDVVVAPRAALRAKVGAHSATGQALRFEWALREESRATSIGGDPEALPPRVPLRIDTSEDAVAEFQAPRRPGHYRLFVTVRDAQGKAGHANLPFRVAVD